MRPWQTKISSAGTVTNPFKDHCYWYPRVCSKGVKRLGINPGVRSPTFLYRRVSFDRKWNSEFDDDSFTHGIHLLLASKPPGSSWMSKALKKLPHAIIILSWRLVCFLLVNPSNNAPRTELRRTWGVLNTITPQTNRTRNTVNTPTPRYRKRLRIYLGWSQLSLRRTGLWLAESACGRGPEVN